MALKLNFFYLFLKNLFFAINPAIYGGEKTQAKTRVLA
jgi:hypothetical protein